MDSIELTSVMQTYKMEMKQQWNSETAKQQCNENTAPERVETSLRQDWGYKFYIMVEMIEWNGLGKRETRIMDWQSVKSCLSIAFWHGLSISVMC